MQTGRKLLESVRFLSLLFYFLFSLFFFLVSTLITKFKRSRTGLASTKPAFDLLTRSCFERNLPVKTWRSAEELAVEERGEGLRMFDINHKKARTLADITLELTNNKESLNNPVNAVDWITDGIKAQNDQWVADLIFFHIVG